MLQSRRVLIAFAVVLLLLSVGAGIASRPAGESAAPTTPRAESVAAGEPPVARTLRIGESREQGVDVQVDRLATVTVEGADAPDVVELVGLGLTAPISPELPATFSLLPSSTGTYPIELVGTGERVGALRVRE